MTVCMASLCMDVNLSNAKLTLFCYRVFFSIASTFSGYSTLQQLLMVLADSTTRSWCIALFDRENSTFDISFQAICAETNPNRRWRFHMCGWNSEVSNTSAASLERFVCHFGQYWLTWIWNMISTENLQLRYLNMLAASASRKQFHPPSN
jgi:hypothetical protein